MSALKKDEQKTRRKEKTAETETEILFRLSKEAKDRKFVEVTDFSSESLFKLFSAA